MKSASILRFLSAVSIILALPVGAAQVNAQATSSVYLIIAPDEFETALFPFIELKTSQGFQTDLALLSETGSTNNEIWNYIQSYLPKPEYVLLAGDTNLIPPGTIDADPVRASACPDNTREWTDLYYAILDHDCDPIPDLILGRLPVQTPDQLTALVNKYLEFDAIPLDSTWRDKLAFVASDDFLYNPLNEQTHTMAMDGTASRGFTGNFPQSSILGGDRLYPKTYLASRLDLLEVLNQGRLAVTYYGPGSATAWDWINLDPFTIADVAALTGSPVPLVLALTPGSADYRVETSMADAWLNHPTGGGLVYIGSSFDPQYNDFGEYLEILFWQKILADPFATTSIGEALHASLKMFHEISIEQQVEWVYWEAYQILGDPSLLIIPCQCGRLWSPQDTYRGDLGDKIEIPVRLTNLDIVTRGFYLIINAPAAFSVWPEAVLVRDLAPGKSYDFIISLNIPLDIPKSSGDIIVDAGSSSRVESPLIVHVEANLQRIYLPVVNR